MSRIQNLFKQRKDRVLNVYCTAGYPKFSDTLPVMRALQQYGADMIELGMPYSDPLADGPVIQDSSAIALKNGMTIVKLFEQLKNFRKEIELPVVLMGYMNVVLQYGFDKFCADASAIGIDGLILPDLPEYEFENKYRTLISRHHLDFIFLITPETSNERIKRLDSLSTGFLYAVSSSSTTGAEQNIHAVEVFLTKVKSLDLKNPVLVGFGIKDRNSFKTVCRFANGVIIGTAYIKSLMNSENINRTTKEFIQSIIG